MSRRSANTTKVFVGSLPAGTTADELRQLFAPYGAIAECDVVNRCGFLHLEDKSLAFKAIVELNNTTFKGTRISVEKGRVKPPPGRDYTSAGRGSRNGFGGPMRSGRDNYRGGPYMRDEYDRRGPPRPVMGGNNYGGGYEHGPAMNDGYNSGPDRRPYMEERRGYDERRYGDTGYMGPGGDSRMYADNHYADSRPPYERRPVNDRNLRNIAMTECPPAAAAPIGGTPPVAGNMHTPIPAIQPYDRRPPPKPMANVGYQEPARNAGYETAPRNPGYDMGPRTAGYETAPRNTGYETAPRNAGYETAPRNAGYETAPRNTGYDTAPRNTGYDTAYPPLQARNYAGGPAAPVRRH